MKIDYSQLQTFITCPRKYQLRYIDKLKKIKYDERDLHQDFGHCIHKALEIYYKDNSIEKAKDWFTLNFNGLDTEKAKTPANGLLLLDRYYNYYQTPTNELSDTHLKTLEVEITDTYNIGNIEYTVKIDRIVESNAGIFVLDHKTTSSIPYNYFYQFDPNMQVSGYCLYAQQRYGQCSGMIIDAICLGHRERAYKGEPAGFWCNFVRDIVNRNKQQLQDFEQNVIDWSSRLQTSIDMNKFPKNENACHQFKGCGFRELCVNCNDEQIKEQLYQNYNPLEYLNNNKEAV